MDFGSSLDSEDIVMNMIPNFCRTRSRTFLIAATLLVPAIGFWGGCSVTKANTMNGFDLSDLEVPLSEIHRGGPPRDGIPALTDPEFLPSGSPHGLREEDRVLGVYRNGIAKAYPLGIMNHHEVANDLFAGEPIAVTYCPLCFTGVAFRAQEPDGARLLLGVSGLLYNSDVLLYDRRTESLWSQIAARAISGPRRGERLEAIPIANTTWSAWRAEHPDSLVLSRNTHYSRNYDRDPYAAYADDEALMFPVRFRMHGKHPKTRVLGVEIDGQARAYPLTAFPETGQHRLEDELAGKPISILIDAEAQSGRVLDAQGEEITSLIAYWFAWFAFHPDTDRYQPAP
jgi:hypothetical protein